MSHAAPSIPDARSCGREAAIARREALSRYGKKALSGDPAAARRAAAELRTAARNGTPLACAEAPRETPAAAARAPATPVSAGAAPSCGCQHGDAAARVEYAAPSYTPEPMSAAQQRRIEQSRRGRGDTAPCRPCGRTRPEPQKVELGTTLAGSTVTGNQIDRTAQVTGSEAGTCRTITGTEYIGAEQYGEFCGVLPAPAAAKVGANTTSRGGRVTGTEVGRSDKVTGDETGTCKRVTGTEYMAAEQAGEFCGTALEPRPEKAGVGMTARKNPISGVDLTRPVAVTGGETGANRAITGSAYTDAAAIGSPAKSEARQSGADKPKGPRGNQRPAGDAPAAAPKGVTGSSYMSTEAFLPYSRTEPFQPPAKSATTRAPKDADAGGEGRGARVTGDDHGASKPVTGTAFIGADQYADFNARRVAAEAINRARLGRSAEVEGESSGRPADGTAEDRARVGACGRPAMATHYRARSPEASGSGAGITGNALDAPSGRQPGDFSIAPPARAAQDSEVRRITGSAFGGNGRITGSLARATGLVSGTPEFRYRDSAGAEWQAAPPASPATEPTPERITGEGRERNVTGDAWDRGGRVTGTEGRSASGRNPTQRGEARSSSLPARTPREVQPAPVNSRITGSSGNSSGGAAVTLSGGARG